MLTITNLAGETEAISQYNGFEKNEELNGALTLSFTSFFTDQNPGHELIGEEGIVEFEGFEFRIKQLKTNRFSKQVTATSIYFENVNNRKYDTFGGTHTLNEFLDYTLAGTGWSFINEDVNASAFIPNFGNDNVVKLIDVIKSTFECEMKIGPNKTLIFSYQLGPDNDEQYRYGHNIKALYESTDTTNLATYIEGFGADGLQVSYTSPNASVFGIRHAEPFRDEDFTDAPSLLEQIKKELIDYPEVSIELDAVELQEKEIGERVWLIHEKLGIEYQTRVIAKKTRYPKHLSSVVLGNRLPQRLSDLLATQKVNIDKNKKETRSRFEQTNERITLEVERVDEAIATLTIEADEIKINVSALDGRMGTAEASISVQAGEIQQRVSYTEYNGNEIASRINQTATTIVLEASKINLLGITNVASTLQIGTAMDYATEKSLQFRTGAYISSPPNTDSLEIGSIGGYVFLSGNTKFGSYYGGGSPTVDFSGATVYGLNYASIYHDHGSQYTYSEIGQNIQIYMNRSNNTMEFVNGTRRLSVSASVLSS